MEMIAGAITVNVGHTGAAYEYSLTNTGEHVLSAVAGPDGYLRFTPTAGFSGKIKSVSVKGITVIAYNYLNLPAIVTRAGDKRLDYIYDAAGRKLSQIVSRNGIEEKRTDYSGEFIYENDTLKIIQHEEGRIVPEGSEMVYQYHLKDHLGNVRLTFTTKPEKDEPLATVETANAPQEQSQYLNYAQVRKIDSRLFDHTNNGTTHNAVRLMGGNTTEVYGLARSLSVMPGDTLNVEVYAKYLDTDKSNWSTALLSTIAAIAGTPKTQVEHLSTEAPLAASTALSPTLAY